MFQVINPILHCNDFNLPNDASLVNFLLYGHETLSAEVNTAVLTAIVNYIHKSTRFDPCYRAITKLPVISLWSHPPPRPLLSIPSMLCLVCFFIVCAPVGEKSFLSLV